MEMRVSVDENEFKRVDWPAADGWVPSDDDDEHGFPVQPHASGLSADDLELLTLAARAIGAVQVEPVEGEKWVNLHFADGSIVYAWNSLMHSDDTLNLSALLHIDIVWVGDSAVFADGFMSEPTSGDPAAAARRAVTRAAADIWKAKAPPPG